MYPIYEISMPDGRMMNYTLPDLQKIISEHEVMKNLLQEINEAREAEFSALSRKTRTQHAIEDFLKRAEARS